MTRAIVLVAVLAACGGKNAAPSCDDVRPMVDRMYATMMNELGPAMKADERAHAARVAAQVAPAMKEAIVEACRADAWSADVIACMKAASSEATLDACEAKLTADQRQHVDDAMGEVVMRIVPPDDPIAEDDDVGVGESGLPECDAYAIAMQAYLDCDEIAPPVKTSARGALDQLRRTWPTLKDPATAPAAKQAAAAACVSARVELEASAKAMGCAPEAAPAAAPDCAVLGPMIRAILAEQLRDVPADKRAAADAQSHALAAPLEATLIDTCKSGRWSASAVACFDRARTGAALVACEAQLTPEQADRLAHAMEDVTAKIAGAPVAAPAANDCDAYVSVANALLACDKLPAGARAELQRRVALVVDGLHRLDDPKLPAARDVAQTCTAARASAKQLAAELGCALR